MSHRSERKTNLPVRAWAPGPGLEPRSVYRVSEQGREAQVEARVQTSVLPQCVLL